MTVFERFTRNARTAVVAAQTEARRLGERKVGPEHLMLGVLGMSEDPVVRIVAASGVDLAAARQAVADAHGIDTDALRSIGIDFEAVRRTVEAEFGSGAFSRAGRPDGPWSGHIPFTRDAKDALKLALRAAITLGHRSIEPGHLILGIARTGENPASALFAACGITESDLETAVESARAAG
jgi:ATP-dependent Clp protease ATP-binding subunit ClpA